jgi:hypothetical protein
MNISKSSLVFAVAALLAQTAFAGLPDGSFKGHTPFVKSPDAMAFLVKTDKSTGEQYAILAEYTRVIGAIGSDRVAITKWVPRLFAYKVTQVRDTRFMLTPLRVGADGSITTATTGSDYLSLKKAGEMKGAILERYDRGSANVVESIKFDAKLGSTWEKLVVGNFFGSHDPTGGDYFHKRVNMTISKDKVASFTQEKIKGEFDVVEHSMGLFTFTPKNANVVGADQVVTRIGVFIDIVNWKPVFTTDELLLVNPDDAKDVGFYYERH